MVQNIYKCYLKRFLDFWISLIVIICISPILLGITIGLYFSNKGAGAFFFHERPGLHGKLFKVIKFKSMTDERDAEGNLLPNEQRITKIGKIIRATSLDELPQLFNVLKGDMALIGPRPLVPRYLKLYSKEQMRWHEVRPGISGWAQCHGRNNIPWTKKFELDVWYVDHVSLWIDIKIICLTVMSVLKLRGIDSGNGKVGAVGFNGTN